MPGNTRGIARLIGGYSMRKFRSFFLELGRVKWPLLASIAVVAARRHGLLNPQDLWTLVAYKIALAFMAFVAAHIAYSQIFPYLDMRGLLFRALGIFEFQADSSEHAQFVAAITFAGACVLRGLIYTAFVLGILMGL